MTVRFVLYALYAAALAAGTLYASYYAWSPYSDEQRYGSGHGGSVYARPTHK